MIHPSGTFEYEAEFSSDCFRGSETVLPGFAKNTEIDRLVGHNPMIRFWNDRLVLVASEKSHSRLRNTSFAIGNAVPLTAHPGDRLHLVRTGSGGIGLSLLREGRLVLAIGAVTAVPLGANINVTIGPRRQNPVAYSRSESWLEFKIKSETLVLKDRGLTSIGDYQIYIERCWEDGIPGTDECVSICAANGPAVNVESIRSAVLLSNGDLKMTHWDGTERFV